MTSQLIIILVRLLHKDHVHYSVSVDALNISGQLATSTTAT